MVSTSTLNRRLYHQQTEVDPTLRGYSVGDDAARDVVRACAESGTVAVDIETAGLGDLSFVVKVVIIATNTTSYVLDATNPVHKAAVREALDAARDLVFQNSPFDVPPLVAGGFMDIHSVDKVVDILLWARIALTGELDQRGLEALEKRFLKGHVRAASKDRLAEWGKFNGLKKSEVFERATYNTPVYLMYAGWDALLTLMLARPTYQAAIEQLTNHPFGRYGADLEQARWVCRREQLVNRALLWRSAKGLTINTDIIAAEQERLRCSMLTKADTLAEFGITDPTNTGQLITRLEADEAFPADYPKTKTGRWSTSKKHIGQLSHPALTLFKGYDNDRRLFTYMEQARLISKRAGGRLHPQVNVLGARTGRMSYGGGAPLQQFTEFARQAIGADEGDEFYSCDWSQIEPVVAANLANDMGLLDKYENDAAAEGTKADIYMVASEAAGIERSTAKVVILAAMYGQGIRSLAGNLSMALGREVDLAEAKALQAKVADAIPGIFRLVGWAAEWSSAVGKTWTLSGRIIDVDRDRGYKGANYTVQGSAADVLSETVAALYQKGLHHGLYMCIHDELVLSKEVVNEGLRLMTTPPQRLAELSGRLPKFKVDSKLLGRQWGHPKKEA